METYKNEQRGSLRTKTIVICLASGIVFILLALFTVINFFPSLTPEIIKVYTFRKTSLTELLELSPSVIESKNLDIVSSLPEASSLEDTSKEDAQKLFVAARLTNVFDFNDRNVDYLVKILDSKSPEFEPYKSVAAYFLLHTFYDSNGDIEFMMAAVNKSEFMRNLVPQAKGVFPGLFNIPFASMNYTEKSLCFTSFLIVLSDRKDSLAIPANASLELGRAYITSQKNLSSRYASSTLEPYLHSQLLIAVERYNDNAMLEKSKQETGFEHTTLVGLNTLAMTIDDLRQFGFGKVFPEVQSINPQALYARGNDIAKVSVPSLYIFSSYLYALHLSKFSEDTQENNDKIQSLVRRMTGLSPFSKVTSHSWVTKYVLTAQSGDHTNYYRKENMATIARRSPLMKEFLIMKGGWVNKDFELRDSF